MLRLRSTGSPVAPVYAARDLFYSTNPSERNPFHVPSLSIGTADEIGAHFSSRARRLHLEGCHAQLCLEVDGLPDVPGLDVRRDLGVNPAALERVIERITLALRLVVRVFCDFCSRLL